MVSVLYVLNKKYINTTVNMALYLEKDLVCLWKWALNGFSLGVIVNWWKERNGQFEGKLEYQMLMVVTHRTHGELMELVAVCSVSLCSSESSCAASFIWGQFCAFLYCFPQTKLHISKSEIHILLKWLPDISIALEQILIFKASLIAEMTVK